VHDATLLRERVEAQRRELIVSKRCAWRSSVESNIPSKRINRLQTLRKKLAKRLKRTSPGAKASLADVGTALVSSRKADDEAKTEVTQEHEIRAHKRADGVNSLDV
jgi:hypothetical protein